MKRLISCLIIAAMLLAALPMAVFAGETDTQEKAVDYIGYQVKDDAARLVFGIKNTDISALTGLGAIIKNQLDGTSATVTNCSAVFEKIFAGDTEFVASTEGYDYVYLIEFTDMFKEMDTFDFVINAIYTTSQGMYQAGERIVENIDQSEYTTISAWSEITSETGKYRLDKNSTFTSSASIASFSGSLDGNGKTVTTSAPLFRSIKGAKISNLVIDGTISGTTALLGGLAIWSETNPNTVVNVTNKATITMSMSSGAYAGGIVGHVKSDATFYNCTNEGTITLNNDKNVNGLGGIVGYGENSNISLINCRNTGSIVINSTVNTVYSGGIAGQLKAVVANFTNCTNETTITLPQTVTTYQRYHRIGGILGYGANATGNSFTFTNCTNSANLTSHGLTGGIAAETNGYSSFVNCINNGNISATATNAGYWIYAAGILADSRNDTGAAETLFKGCKNYGDISAQGVENSNTWEVCAAGILGQNIRKTRVENCENHGNLTSPSFDKAFVGVVVGKLNSDLTIAGMTNDGTVVGNYTTEYNNAFVGLVNNGTLTFENNT